MRRLAAGHSKSAGCGWVGGVVGEHVCDYVPKSARVDGVDQTGKFACSSAPLTFPIWCCDGGTVGGRACVCGDVDGAVSVAEMLF